MSVSTSVGGNTNDENSGPDESISNADSTTNERPSCNFGRQCFRKNPRHKLDMAHPGDIDYIIPDMPEPNADAVKCKYGRKCYRLNPEHFKTFTHPRNINLQQNYRKHVLKIQNRRNSNSSFDYNVSDDDPFGGDSEGSDYNPSDDE